MKTPVPCTNASHSNLPRLLLGLPAIATGILLGTATASQGDHPWHFGLSINGFLAGLSGDVAARGVPAEIDMSFGDLAEHMEFCAAGRLTVGYEKWALSTEVSFLGLAASTRAASFDWDQWLVEPTLGYQFSKMFQGFAGVRYNNLDGEIHFRGPLGRVGSGTQDWYDPIVGAQLSLPVSGKKLTFDGRFDVGGFGIASDITWQAFPYLNWHFSEVASLQLGYRWLTTDYEDGSGSNRFEYDVIVQGPQLGFTLNF